MAGLRENYQQPAKVRNDSTVAADSQLVSGNRFSYKPVIRAPSNNADNQRLSDWFGQEKHQKGNDSDCPAQTPSTSQYVLIDRHINNSVQVKLVKSIGVLDWY